MVMAPCPRSATSNVAACSCSQPACRLAHSPMLLSCFQEDLVDINLAPSTAAKAGAGGAAGSSCAC